MNGLDVAWQCQLSCSKRELASLKRSAWRLLTVPDGFVLLSEGNLNYKTSEFGGSSRVISWVFMFLCPVKFSIQGGCFAMN